MSNPKSFHRKIAIIMLAVFIPSLLPVNLLYANGGGPTAPEAVSFEPVDATDMVNLLTGQYSYVLPLLNVPSPEGGYPLALSYHAGIAYDQQASWVGLGWNVNPGAISRSVNGYPDDIKSGIEEYLYDQGEEGTINTVSLNYSNGATSVGVGFNWGSNQSLSGFVSVGVGFDLGGGYGIGVNATMGTNGYSSLGVGLQTPGGLTVGINASNRGNVNANIGLIDTNGAGFSISTDGAYTLKSNNISIHGSNNGIGISISSKDLGSKINAGTGISISYKSNINQGDYRFSSEGGWNIPIVVPTPIGFFGINFGRQKYRYTLNKRKGYTVDGPIYFYAAQLSDVDNSPNFPITPIFDTNEISLSGNDKDLNKKVEILSNNIVLPNYDTYNVTGQGLSGSMSPHLFKKGALSNESTQDIASSYRLIYQLNYSPSNAYNFNHEIPDVFKFSRAEFYFENEISSYLAIQPSTFNSNGNQNIITNFNTINPQAQVIPPPKRKTSNYVEYFISNDITHPYNYEHLVYPKGFMKASLDFDYSIFGLNQICAYKITAIDGKTYHYSLPVWNHETISRTHGMSNGKPERESYFEKRQLYPYATHWLLTAITGPDFVDNGDRVVGEGDLGYWVSFEYGKWSDGAVWKNPYKEDYIIDEENSEIKTWIRGRKDIYYLDRIKTRTHTAIFVKSPRTFEKTPSWTYKSVNHNNNVGNNAGTYDNGHRFTIPSQSQLRLDKIILLKNEDDIIDKSFNQQSQSLSVVYPQSIKIYNHNVKYNSFNRVVDTGDNWSAVISKAIKVIDFNYDYSLVTGDNRLTLKQVSFKGKAGNTVLPPYIFSYNNTSTSYGNLKEDDWGYFKNDPSLYSLKEIITPQGAKIRINYEKNRFRSVVPYEVLFNKESSTTSVILNNNQYPHVGNNNLFKIKSNYDYGVEVGDILDVNYFYQTNSAGGGGNVGGYSECNRKTYVGEATVIQSLGNNEFLAQFNTNSYYEDCTPVGCNGCIQSKFWVTYKSKLSTIYSDAGIRTESITISDGVVNFKTVYKYGENEDGVGYVSYVPFIPNINKQLSHSAYLPAPRPMYEYTTITELSSINETKGKIRYKFNIFKEKDPSLIKYGEFFEITRNSSIQFTNQVSNLENLSGTKKVEIDQFTIKDNLASIGQLLEVISLNNKNQITGKITNQYYTPSEGIPNNMGIKQESFEQYKMVEYYDNNKNGEWFISTSTHRVYPSILKSSTTKTNGYSYTTEYNDYDLISGIPKEQIQTTSDGRVFKSRVVPAYTKYSGMGSKVDDINNANMLSQIAASYSYLLDNGVWKETGVGITTWNNNWTYQDHAGDLSTPSNAKEKIWRKHKTYVWNGATDSHGIFQDYNSSTDTDDGFNWQIGVGNQPTHWKQVSEITLYDHFSMPLEVKDINNNKGATKMDIFSEKIEATGNGAYNEIYYSGAENIYKYGYWLSPEIRMENASRSTQHVHTGKYSVAATNNSKLGVVMRNGHREGRYKLSVWVHKSNVNKARVKTAVNGSSSSPVVFNGETYSAGNWVLKTHYFTINNNNVEFFPYVCSSDNTTVYFDDLMIRPVTSSIMGYVYNEYDELTHIIGDNGLATRYEYDAAGRLIKTYVEIIDDPTNNVTGGFKLQSDNKYHYKNL